jgi:hypothetical protein
MASRAVARATRADKGHDQYVRECRALAWRMGDLSHALNGSQRELRAMYYSRRSRRYVAKIARRWGKTRTCSVLAFESALRGPNRRVLYAAQTQSAVREFVAPHFQALADDAPPDERPELVGHEMRFHNGSRIVLQGCEDQLKADRLRGPAAHDAFIDEGGYIPILFYVVTSVIRPQLSTTRGSMLIASSPPESPDHPFEDFAIEAEAKGAFMRRDVYDAPHVPDDEIAEWCEDVGGPDSIAWKREGLALSVTDPRRAVVPEFSELESLIVGEWPRPAYFHAFVVGDLGYVDLTVLAFAFFDFEHSMLVIEDEAALRRPTSDIVQAEATKRAHALWGEQRPLVRKLDGPRMTIADVARLETAPLAEGAEEPERWGAVFNGELSQGVNALRVLVKRGRLRVHPRCRTIIAHLRSARWNAARTSFERVMTDEGQHHYDGAAAVVYLAREARAKEHLNPAPRLPPGIYPGTGWNIPRHLLTDPRAENLRQAFKPKRERR